MLDFQEFVERVRELNPTVTIREAVISDGVHFVELFNTYYKRKTGLDYFRWQFFDSAFNSKLFCAFDAGKLIGYYGIKSHPLTNGVLAGFAIDFLIDLPYRKRGIGYLLEDAVRGFCQELNIAVLLALPNAYGNAALKALGWRSICKIDTLMLNKPAAGAPKETLMNFANAPLLVEFSKTKEYRQWRFDLNPIYKYSTLQLGEMSSATTKLFIDPNNREIYGDIVDFSCNLDMDRLVNEILVQMRQKKVRTITTWALPHTQAYSFFTGIGFKAIPQERYFCVQIIDKGLTMLEDVNNWNLVQADAEIF